MRNMSSTPKPRARNGMIWVVEALKLMPSTEQIPRPAATERETRTTPAIPIPLWELTASFHRSSDTHA